MSPMKELDDDFRWLAPPESPWPVPVLDVRPITLSVTSFSGDIEAARNAISFSTDDGTGFVGHTLPTQRTIPCSLTYYVNPVLADGVLFAPSAMEHKWAVFYHQSKILFVRSWQRRLILTADVLASHGQIELTQLNGVAMNPGEDPEFTQAAADFILRTHALREAHPAPLPRDPGQDLRSAALLAFNLFGNFAHYATHHRFTSIPSIRPLRTHSLLHIAIARVDLAAAQEQLDRGVPISLLAPDGSTTLHWALASANPEALAWVLAHGLPVDARSDQGATALMNAVQDGRSEVVSWFLANGADPNAADRRGFTSLHRAAEIGSAGIVKVLLDAGAAPNIEAADGKTPIALAASRGHSDIVAMLQSN
jgi:hypothetical protein